MFKRVSRIIFDYDDTLIRHRAEEEITLMAEFLNIQNVNEFVRQVSNFYAGTTKTVEKKIISKEEYNKRLMHAVPILWQNNLSIQDFHEASRYKEEKMNLVVEDTLDVLEYLSLKQYQLFVLTNGFLDEQRASIKLQGLEKYFDKIYAWDNYYPKPNKLAFLRAMEKTKPYENVMIGNNIQHDIVPAKKLGIYTFGINLPEHIKTKDKPHVILTKLSDLKKYL